MQNRELQYMMATAVFIAGSCVAGLVLNVVKQPRSTARTITCLSNMRQVALGLRMYEEDYDGRYPRASVWMDATFPYEKNHNNYRCPQVPSAQPTDFGFAFNSTLALKTLEKGKAPEKVIMLYDSNDLRWNANAPNRTGVANPPRHQGMDNFGFADSHVKPQKLTDKDE